MLFLYRMVLEAFSLHKPSPTHNPYRHPCNEPRDQTGSCSSKGVLQFRVWVDSTLRIGRPSCVPTAAGEGSKQTQNYKVSEDLCM